MYDGAQSSDQETVREEEKEKYYINVLCPLLPLI